MKFAICQELFEGWTWERQCRFAAELGYAGLEVAPFTIAPRIEEAGAALLDAMRATAEREGVRIIGLHWLLAKTTGLHLTSRDEATRQATADYLAALAEACARLGGDLMVLGSPQQRNLAEGMPREEGVRLACDVFRRCLDRVAACRVRICLEPLTPKETNFINSCAEAMEIIDRLNHPALCLHQDVKAMLAESLPIPDLIRQYAGRVGHFHVNDGNLLGPGMGPTDYAPILRALLETRYPGYVSVEVFDYSPGAERIARESIEYLQRVLKSVAGAGPRSA